MKPFILLVSIALFAVGTASSAEFKPVEPPPSSDDNLIVLFKDNKTISLPNSMAGIFLNERSVILIMNEGGAFSKAQIRAYNRCGFLLKE